MADWIASIEGTEAAPFWASVLALISACAHATFGALQKGRFDPWLVRGAIDFSYLVMALPIAFFVFPLPVGRVWLILVGVFFVHLIYKILMGMSYQRGAYTAVYPVVRGTGPLATVVFAILVFQEQYSIGQWVGVLLLSGSILTLALVNISKEKTDRATITAALGLAFASGLAVAAYTIYDAWGIRQVVNPFTFLVWFFIVDGIAFPIIAYRMWRRDPNRPEPVPLMLRGLAGGLIGFVSFGCVMLATRLDKVGEAASLRETSVVFAALIGWLFLGEKVGPVRTVLMLLIAAGAVLVEFG
ncbi:EamA family transporter [Rhodobacteraceae bacterium NNCM2]|nr:EamA family transporter [Coraliihabitans acroporae]